ncbi:hypothetical protein OSSY52_08010 [Tepiditoga spiralis]|uniref:Histidine kinase n=1 Tax=Tepiditoga spiralis TaxID=2108365 RepID=A0A7G1G2Q4_9BACT|nr:hypothetical protein [Tepiditoga spiralis]BBE30660.1 hypothetical protein OSSY52_08010 [Tepiditoga spiralis]
MEKEMSREDLLKRKKILELEKASVAKYMGPDEHDKSLEEEWEKINKELAEIEKKLAE